jgi:purine catabolism regulator
MNSISFSLKDLIRLSFSEPVTWLTGKASNQRAVHWVTTREDEMLPGDVLLLPASSLNAELFNRVRNRNLAAVLLIGDASLPQEFDPGDLIVICIAETLSDIQEIQRRMLTILINQRSALIERGVKIHAQLSQLEAEGMGLVSLVQAMYEISSRGILIQDKRGHILSEHSSPTLSGIWKDVLEKLGSLESLPEFLIDRKRAGSQGTIFSQKIPGGLERLIAPIIVKEMARGYLSIVGLENELDDLDHLVIEQGRLVCAIEMARNKAIREAEKRLEGDLLSALLQDNLSPREASLWVQTMGLDLSQAHVALRFAWDSPSPPSQRRLATIVNGEFARLGLRVIVNAMGNEIICFCQVPAEMKRPEPALALGKAVLDQATREYPEIPARCGIGAMAQELQDWRVSLRQAGQALEMARRLEERKPLFYSDLSVYRLLFQLEYSPELIAFRQETLGALLAYEGVSELIHTLEAYFEHNGNLSQTAEALFIHRNTLIYRMERIAAITDLDLDNAEDRLKLQLALHIYRMKGGGLG